MAAPSVTPVNLPPLRSTGEGADLAGLYKALAQTGLDAGSLFSDEALALYPQLTGAERKATSQQRTGDLRDLNRLGSGYMDALDRINPNWRASLDALNAESMSAAGPNPFLDSLEGFSLGAFDQARSAGPSALRLELDRQALDDLQLGRFLSPEQERGAEQSARAAWSARGLAYSPGAVGAEILNRDAVATDRQNQRRAFAGNQASAGLAEDNSLWQRLMGAGQLGVGVGGLRQNDDQLRRGFLLNNANAQQGAFGPLLGFFGRTNVSPTAGGNLLQGGQGLASSASPVLSYGSDLYNTNFNAQAAANFANTKAMNDASAAAFAMNGVQPQVGVDPSGRLINATPQNTNGFLDNFGRWSPGSWAGPTGAPGAGGAPGTFCWVAREVFGDETTEAGAPKWEAFLEWMLDEAPSEMVASYARHGEDLADYLHANPDAAKALRPMFEDIVALSHRRKEAA